MVRVGVDENLAEELLADFPPEAQIVRLPRTIPSPVEVDFWIVPFYRKDAATAFLQLRGSEGGAVADGGRGLDCCLGCRRT